MSINVLSSSSRSSVTSQANYRRGMLNGATNSCAAESVVRNIAEGAGRWSEADSAKHYKIARGEAMECAASLDVMKLRRVVVPERYEYGIRLLESVVAMLTKML